MEEELEDSVQVKGKKGKSSASKMDLEAPLTSKRGGRGRKKQDEEVKKPLKKVKTATGK